MPTDFVFLHGGGQGGWVWDETIAALDRQSGGHFGRALTLDIPGCGRKRDRTTDDIDVRYCVRRRRGMPQTVILAKAGMTGECYSTKILIL